MSDQSAEPGDTVGRRRGVGAIAGVRALGLPVAAITLGVAIASGAALLILDLHRRTERDVRAALVALSVTLTEQADRSLQGIELVQQAVIDELKVAGAVDRGRYAALASTPAMHANLRARIAALPQINAITVIDHAGKLLNFSRYWPIPNVDISDRDYFRALAAEPELQRFVGRPVPNRGDGAWTIYIARKVTAPDGTFLGLVLGAVELSYFESLYRQVTPSEDAGLALFRDDGMLLVRHPRRADAVGRTFVTASAPAVGAGGVAAGFKRAKSPIDGKERLIAGRGLSRYPITFTVSRTAEAAFASWRRQALCVAAVAAAFEMALAGLMALGLRQARARERVAAAESARVAAEERARGERAIGAQYARLGVALDSMVQGLCLFDAGSALIVMNARFASMHAVPEGMRRPGTPADALRDHLRKVLGGPGSDAARGLVEAYRRTVDAREAVAMVLDIADGRAIALVHAATPEGGWVCTHEDVSERRRNEERIAHMARHDALTGLPNRFDFNERLDAALADRRGDGAVSLLCLDLDGFKAVNDTLGHPAGDELLRMVSARLRDLTGPGELVARLGGDEFAVACAVPRPREDIVALARRITDALGRPFLLRGQEIVIGSSVGVARSEDGEANGAGMLRRADVAMYEAKGAGRGTWRFHDAAMDADVRFRARMASELRHALSGDQLDLLYQPLVNARDGALVGFEALLRWQHPERGLVGPDEFVPIAEETGLIKPIGAWVLRRACADAAEWPSLLKVAVNLSPVQFQSGDLAGDVGRALAAAGLDGGRLELEITESVLLKADSATLDTLNALRALGPRLSMDDFGTGYASLSSLRRFPFDKIKIDRTFVHGLEGEPAGLEIVRAVIAMGRALGMAVLAEGVETERQAAILRDEGCHELQGFLFARPLPVVELGDLMRRRLPDPASQRSAAGRHAA